MTYIAKETLRDGFTVVANPGTMVGDELVEKYGWQDKVDALKGDVGGGTGEPPDATGTADASATRTNAAKSATARKS